MHGSMVTRFGDRLDDIPLRIGIFWDTVDSHTNGRQ